MKYSKIKKYICQYMRPGDWDYVDPPPGALNTRTPPKEGGWKVTQTGKGLFEPEIEKVEPESVGGKVDYRGSYFFKNYWDARAWLIKLTREYERKLAQLNRGK